MRSRLSTGPRQTSRHWGLACVVAVGAAASGAPGPATAGDDSFFALITHKAGFAKGRAHNHLIVASSPQIQLELDPASPLKTRCRMSVRAEQLVVDAPDLQKRWYPRLEQLGILDQPFKGASEKDRAKIRSTMLSSKQLHADRFPGLEARILGIEEKPTTVGKEAFEYQLSLELSVHGQTTSAPLAARLHQEGGKWVLEAVGTFRFTDFGIRPFSAFAGAVKNKDVFHVYARLIADQ